MRTKFNLSLPSMTSEEVILKKKAMSHYSMGCHGDT